MDLFEVCITILVAVVTSNSLAKAIPVLPLPLIQALFGALVGLLGLPRISPGPELILLLFFPPLLFWDAWRTSRDTLLRHGLSIAQRSFGLVLFTVFGMAWVIYLLIPGMSLSAAFAIAAVLSPTDAVAITAVAERHWFPRPLLAILKGEALLNDAAGLFCLHLALAMLAGRQFTPTFAAFDLARLAVGGIVVGVAVTLTIVFLKNHFATMYGEDTTNQILISLLVPFAVYLIANRLQVSAILAVVGSGLTMNYAELHGGALALTRVRRQVVWATISTALNGMLFVVLGEQFPAALSGARRELHDAGYLGLQWLILWVGVISVCLYLLRVLWILVSLSAAHLGRQNNRTSRSRGIWRSVAVETLGGVRGSVSYAAILTLPVTLPDGSQFPYRDVCIVVTASVVVLTLLVAMHFLPRLLGRPEIPEPLQEDSARAVAAAAGVQAIERATASLIAEGTSEDVIRRIAKRVATPYRQRLAALSEDQVEKMDQGVSYELMLSLMGAAFRAERDAIVGLNATQTIDEATSRRLIQEVDIAEIAQMSRMPRT